MTEIEMTPVADAITEKPTDKMDMALDDIVKTMRKPKRGGGRGRGGRGNSKGNRGGGKLNQGGKRKKAGGKGVKVPQSLKTSGSPKLSISNLNFGVSDSDLGELFSEFGNMKSAAVHYNSSGKSLGTAHVIFMHKEQAMKAAKQYNGVHLDGRPMRINMEGGIITVAGKKGNIVKRLGKGQKGVKGKGGAKGVRGRGGRGRGRGGKGRGGEKAKPKTAEELDAELDAYLNTKPQTAEDLDADLDAYSKSKDASDEAEK